jgi:hypothetical protein
MATVHAFRDEPGVQRRESFAVTATRRLRDVLDQNADHGVSEPAADALRQDHPRAKTVKVETHNTARWWMMESPTPAVPRPDGVPYIGGEGSDRPTSTRATNPTTILPCPPRDWEDPSEGSTDRWADQMLESDNTGDPTLYCVRTNNWR